MSERAVIPVQDGQRLAEVCPLDGDVCGGSEIRVQAAEGRVRLVGAVVCGTADCPFVNQEVMVSDGSSSPPVEPEFTAPLGGRRIGSRPGLVAGLKPIREVGGGEFL